MPDRRAYLVAALLGAVAIGVLIGAVAGTAGDRPALAPEPNATASVEAVSLSGDLGLVVHAGDTRMRTAFEERLLEERLENATPERTEAILESKVAELSADLEALEREERAAISAYAAGDIDANGLVRTLVRLDTTARANAATVERLVALARASPDGPDSTAFDRLATRHTTLMSEIRAGLMVGAGEPTTSAIALLHATEASLVISGVVDRRHHREAVRYDRLARSGPDRVGNLTAAEAIVADTYPETTETEALRRVADDRYLVERLSPTGAILAFVHGPSEAVYLERQRVRLSAVEFDTTHSTTGDELEVRVSRTDATGPMRLQVTTADGDTPVEAAVYIRIGATWTRLGTTDGGGILWTSEPMTSFDLRAIDGDRMITVSVE